MDFKLVLSYTVYRGTFSNDLHELHKQNPCTVTDIHHRQHIDYFWSVKSYSNCKFSYNFMTVKSPSDGLTIVREVILLS